MISSSPISKRIILCIDDNQAILRYEKALLQNAGYAVITAESAQQGLSLVTMCECDAVLLDYEMPGMNGNEAAFEIKRVRPELIVIMLSGSEVPTHALEWVDAFVPKVEASQQLLPMIADLCSRTDDAQQKVKEGFRSATAAAISSLPHEAGLSTSCNQLKSRKEFSMEDRVNEDLPLEHNQSGEALRASEVSDHRLFETTEDGILILEAHSGLIADVNPFLAKLLDYPREDFIGKTLWEIGPFRRVEASKTAFGELQDREYIRYETLPLKARSGGPINAEVASNAYGVNGNSVTQCDIHDTTPPERPEDLDDRARQSQKMEAVGQLAGGVAHDFNNLLGVILGYCDLLQVLLPPDDSKRRMVEHIHSAGTHAAVLTRQLLAFSRRQVLRPVALDLNKLVTGMGTMLRRLIGEHIEVSTFLSPDLGRVKADPIQIEQILINLAVNARDAMPSGGTITIETANVELDDSHGEQHPEVKPGSYVMLAMSDTGIGMDSETQARIFEPFFTTKPPGEGTGLGLSTVHGIVRQSEGYIWAYSDLGRGTAFKVYLPCIGTQGEILGREETLSIRGGSETILLVEDNAPLRQMTREILQGFGYAVLDSGRPSEAIRVAERHLGPIALLVTDVVMPECNGIVLARQLSALRPEMKVLYTSGYSTHASIEQGEREAGSPLLEKPFTRDGLAKGVRELLDSPVS
jgi:signal transduction histidine kinase/DNA-binding response OmpR family regulator